MNSRPPRPTQTRAPITPIHRGPQALPSQQYGAPQYGPPIQHAPNAALLIDFDNVTMGIRSDLAAELRSLLSSDIIKGKVAVQRAYADWRRYPQYIVPLAESSIDMIMAPAYGSSKKNATDIRLAVDAIELVFTRSEIGTYILLSGDSDFASLVTKLKEYGKYVIGVGIRESSSDLLVMNCDEYYSYNALAGLVKQTEEDVAKWDPWELVVEAIGRMKKNGDVMRSDRLKQVMQDIDASFDEKSFGYSKFSRFVSDAAEKSLLSITKLENGQLEVGPGSAAPGATVSGATATAAATPASADAPRRGVPVADENGSRDERGRRGRRGGRGRGRERDDRGERPERDALPTTRTGEFVSAEFPAGEGGVDSPRGEDTTLSQPEDAAPSALREPAFPSEPSLRDTSPRESSPREPSPREAPPRETSPREASPREASPRTAAPRETPRRDAAPREATLPAEPSPRAPAARQESPPRLALTARVEPSPRPDVGARDDIGRTGERLTRQEAFDLVRRATAALVTGDDAAPARDVRAKAFELLARDSESLSERNFERILRDAHDQEVIDLRRRGTDFEVAFPASVAPMAEQLNRAAAAHAAPAAGATPGAAPPPRGMAPRSAPARGGRAPGRGGAGAPPPGLLLVGVVDDLTPSSDPASSPPAPRDPAAATGAGRPPGSPGAPGAPATAETSAAGKTTPAAGSPESEGAAEKSEPTPTKGRAPRVRTRAKTAPASKAAKPVAKEPRAKVTAASPAPATAPPGPSTADTPAAEAPASTRRKPGGSRARK